MQRYFTRSRLSLGDEVLMDTDDSHHIRNVMRMGDGDAVELVDSVSALFVAEIVEVDEVVRVRVASLLEGQTELPVRASIIVPLLKGDKLDWLLQKATELGAHAFHLYEAERAVVKLDAGKLEKRIARFEKIVKEAAEQSKRLVVPEIKHVGKVSAVSAHDYGKLMIAYEGAALDESKSLSHVFDDNLNEVGCIFGPEGGFSDSELELLSEATTIRLGPRILRAETAPLYFLSALSFKYE